MHAAAHVVPDVETDARKVFDVVMAGGVALIYLDVAYALVARSEAAVRRIYAAKQRDYAKPMGLVGGLQAHDALHVLASRQRDMVRAIAVAHDLPLSVVAPFQSGHPFLQMLSPFLLQQCSADGTMNLLLNAGALRTRLGELSWEAGVPLVGTSANVSFSGSKYRAHDVEPEIRAACGLVIDHGVSKYHNGSGLSSTIIDFHALRVVRRGVCFAQISAVLRDEFQVDLA